MNNKTANIIASFLWLFITLIVIVWNDLLLHTTFKSNYEVYVTCFIYLLIVIMLIITPIHLLARQNILCSQFPSINESLVGNFVNNDSHNHLNALFLHFNSKKDKHQKQLEFQAYLLEHLGKSITVINAQGEVIYCNRCASNLLGIDGNNYDGFTLGNLPYDQKKLEKIKKHLSTGATWKEEQTILADSKVKILMHCFDPLNRKDMTGAIIIISYDISDLTIARMDAESANTAKSLFLANMTHELRTPMIGVLGSVELLEQSNLSQDQVENLNTIKECGEKLLNKISDIIDVSSIETGLLELNPAPTNLSEVLEKAAAAIKDDLKSKDLLLEMDIDQSVPPVAVFDDIKFRQIVISLLYNAVKFTFQGSIKITARLESNDPDYKWLLVSVADTGIGIPEDSLETIFNRFTQVDNSTSRRFGGTGLGLYISKQLIELMGGQIWAQSQEGKGTIITFKIPITTELDINLKEQFNLSANSQIAAVVDLTADIKPINVLLVEDNELNRKLIAHMLINYGFETITANNGLECLNLLQYNKIDIILMDMQMPVLDGYETTRIIRKNPAWSQIPIIAITANSMSNDRGKCLACGCSSYLPKPFKTDLLVQEIRSGLQNQFYKDRSNSSVQQLVTDLMPEFIEMLNELLNDLQQAIEMQDLEDIKSISHDLKGTSGMYGFMSISELSAHIEEAAANKNYVEISLLFDQITSLAQELKYPDALLCGLSTANEAKNQ
ncbi:MAG: ATP-binding protein [Syntrophomonas sp.]|nr:ATP-binding protein [Syntrophomonas sp.]